MIFNPELISFLTQNALFTWAIVMLVTTLLLLAIIRVWVWGCWQRDYFNFAFLVGHSQASGSVLTQKYLFFAGFFLIFLSLFITGTSWGLALLVALVLGVVFFISKLVRLKKDNTALKKQLPVFLRSLGSTLKAGYSVPQALVFVAQEAQNPIKQKLNSGVRLLSLQQPLELVLQDWQHQLHSAEFNFLADSLRLQARNGGSLVDLCYSVASLLEDRYKLEQDIKSFTAQGKLSGLLMAALWPISLLLFSWLSPSHTEVLFTTTPGRILLGLSLGLEVMGFFLIWRLVRLKI